MNRRVEILEAQEFNESDEQENQKPTAGPYEIAVAEQQQPPPYQVYR